MKTNPSIPTNPPPPPPGRVSEPTRLARLARLAGLLGLLLLVLGGVPGRAGEITLDGLDDTVVATTTVWPSSSTLRSYTIEAWVFTQRLGAKVITDDAYDLILTEPDGAVRHQIWYGTTSGDLSRSTVTLPDGHLLNEWVHIAIMVDAPGRRQAIAINGEFGGWDDLPESAADFFISPTQAFVVGGYYNTSGSLSSVFKGRIDEIRISDVARYSADFTPPPRFVADSSTRALYHFDEPPGATRFLDSSASGLHLEARGGAALTPSTRVGDVFMYPPAIVNQPEDRAIRSGEAVSFSVTATGSDPLTYQWYKNGFALAKATNATVVIAAVQPADAGSYQVEVRNAAGAARSRLATLVVGQSPVITSHPAGQTASAGGTVTFGVAATGTAPLSYAWTFNGATLADGPRVAGATTATLTLTSASAASEGTYAVRVSNPFGSQTSKTAKLTLATPPPTPAVRLWIDDGFPADSHFTGPGTGAWKFITSPDAISGNAILVSDLSDGFHQIYGDLPATAVTAEDELVASVYLDPTNPPRTVMLQWYDALDGWNHRAYWGETPDWALHLAGSPAAARLGSLPPAGHWIRLRVPATSVDLAGRTLRGLALSLTGGQASWDAIGIRPVGPSYWLDDAYPSARPNDIHTDGVWEFVSQPAPVSGSKALRSDLSSGFHQVYGDLGPQATTVLPSDLFVASVHLDPATPPRTIMLQWHDPLTGWNHRAFWGETPDWAIPQLGSAAAMPMGPLPPTGTWIQLRVPALAVDLAGHSIDGFALTLAGGRASWDAVGLAPGEADLWIDDSLPAGAVVDTQGSGPWRFVNAPTPVSGRVALLSDRTPGFHQMYGTLGSAASTLAVGDHLTASVYLDPINPPRMVMLQWYDPADGWNHRAFWGDVPSWAAPLLGTPAARRIGPLPATGRWVGLSVPVESVGLAGRTVQGFALSLTDGQAVFDAVGLLRPATQR